MGWIDGRVDLWDVPGRRWIRALTNRDQLRQGQVAFSPVRNLLVATSEPKVVRLYDLDSGRESVLWRAPDQGVWTVWDLSFSQDGSRVAIYAGSTPELGDAAWVVNVSSSRIESHHPTIYSEALDITSFKGAARLAHDNRRLYLARSDVLNQRYSIQCIDLITGQIIWDTETQRDFGLTALAVSPDWRMLASGSQFADPTIRIWDAATGRLLVRLDGHTGWVCKLAFARDGRRLISASVGGREAVKVWDLGTRQELLTLSGSGSILSAAKWTADGDVILAGTPWQAWRAPSWEEIAAAEAKEQTQK